MKIILLTVGLLLTTSLWAVHISTGLHKSLIDVQDKQGDEVKNPFSPFFSVGTNFRLSGGFGFSPQLGFIYHTVQTDDTYGEYKMYSLFALYDFLWVPQGYKFFGLRFGLGTFRKTIKGEGGSVTVPNGSSTIKAYRPESSTSYSGTFNLGTDFYFHILKKWFTNFGVRSEIFVFRPLSKENRNYTYTLGVVGYF
jgi:hypothetical protein